MEKKMEATIVSLGYRDNGKENGSYYSIKDLWVIGIMEKKMEATIVLKIFGL